MEGEIAVRSFLIISLLNRFLFAPFLSHIRLIFLKYFTDWSVIYVGIMFSVLSCVIICGAAYVLCKNKKRSILKLGIHKSRDGGSRSSRSKRRYTKLDQFDSSMELRSKYIFLIKKIILTYILISTLHWDTFLTLFNYFRCPYI